LLPPFSAFLQFQFKLTRPYISRDDEIFHINDNPVKKDKVFKVPLASATNWKGNLRWTMMKIDLEPKRENPPEFAHRRFRHTLLFGTEKGFETARDWEAFLDGLCPGNKETYRRLLREHFNPDSEAGLPHNAGWLRFYPTFFDCIGLEVINPHDRMTRAGTQPIYFESVPIGATGGFSLLYAPFGRISAAEAKEDLQRVAAGIEAMLPLMVFRRRRLAVLAKRLMI
jgi:CRISPR-associated protein Cmr2